MKEQLVPQFAGETVSAREALRKVKHGGNENTSHLKPCWTLIAGAQFYLKRNKAPVAVTVAYTVPTDQKGSAISLPRFILASCSVTSAPAFLQLLGLAFAVTLLSQYTSLTNASGFQC
jgi:hypothetical protein